MIAATSSQEMMRARLNDWATRSLAYLGTVTFERIEIAAGGASSETYLVDVTADRGAIRHWVLRIEPRAHQIYEDPSVERQFRVIEQLSADPALPIPSAIAFESDDTVVGAPFFLMERAPGRAPPNDYHSAGLFHDATPAMREALWACSIDHLARLHRADTRPLAFLAYPAAQPITDAVGQELARWDSFRAWAELPFLPLYDTARDWLERNRPPPAEPGFAWGDARLANMLFSGDLCTALLDWETASLGGAESDLGWWLFYDRMITEEVGVPRLAGLGDGDATVALWESLSGRRACNMEWHIVFAGYRFALISERARALAKAAGRLPPSSPAADNPAVRLLGRIVDRGAAHV